jgi:hypothetical protein
MFIPGIEESCCGDACSPACACAGAEGSELCPEARPNKIAPAASNTTKDKFLLKSIPRGL